MATLAVLIIFVLIPYAVAEPKKVKYAALSPSYYPRIVAIALLVLGVAISIRTILAPSDQQQASSNRHPNAFFRIAFVFVLLGLYAVSVSWLGFILASSLVLFATFWLAGERRLLLMTSMAILIPFGLYLFFLKVASVPIPLGILQPLLSGI